MDMRLRSAEWCLEVLFASSRSCPGPAHSLRYARRLRGCWPPEGLMHANRTTGPDRRVHAGVAADRATTPARLPSGSTRAIRPRASAGTDTASRFEASWCTRQRRVRRRASRPAPYPEQCTQRQGDYALLPGQCIQIGYEGLILVIDQTVAGVQTSRRAKRCRWSGAAPCPSVPAIRLLQWGLHHLGKVKTGQPCGTADRDLHAAFARKDLQAPILRDEGDFLLREPV